MITLFQAKESFLEDIEKDSLIYKEYFSENTIRTYNYQIDLLAFFVGQELGLIVEKKSVTNFLLLILLQN